MTETGRTGRLLGIGTVASPGAPMVNHTEIVVDVATGLPGDCRGRSQRRKITLLTREAWGAVCAELGTSLPWMTRRANLFVEGPDLRDTIGCRLRIGKVVLEITGETKPCANMDDQHQGLRETLVPDWRGGVTSIILTPGTIQIGDDVRLEPAEES